MTHSTPSTDSNSTPKSRRFSLIRLFNNPTKTCSDMDQKDESSPEVPSVPAHYRHSMAPSMGTIQNEMMRERRKSIAAIAEASFRSVSLDLKHSSISPAVRAGQAPVEMTDKMRQFDELLQKRRGSTIRISLTPSLLQETP